jgi:hypothetical protein
MLTDPGAAGERAPASSLADLKGSEPRGMHKLDLTPCFVFVQRCADDRDGFALKDGIEGAAELLSRS